MAKGQFQLFNDYITKEIKSLGTTYTAEYAEIAVNLFSSAIVIYIIYVGYQYMAGKRQTPIADLVWDLAKFSILLMFIQNTGGYLNLVTDAAQGLKEGFAGGSSIWSGLDELTITSNKLSETVKEMDNSWTGFDGVIAGFFIWIGIGTLSLVSSLILLVADITMQFMLLTAPLFIFCLMWGWLRQMFNNWLQIIFSSILTVLFVSLIVNINIAYMRSMINFTMNKGNTSTGMYIIGFYILCSGIMGSVLVIAAKSMASSIASVGVEATVQGAAMSVGGALGRYSGAAAGRDALVSGGKSLSGKGATFIADKTKSTLSRVSSGVINKLKAKS